MKMHTTISVRIDPRYLVAAGLWLAQQGAIPQGRAAILRLATEVVAQRFLQTSQLSLEDAWALLDRLWPLHSHKGNETLFWKPIEERVREVLAAFERLKERPDEDGRHDGRPDEDGRPVYVGQSK